MKNREPSETIVCRCEDVSLKELETFVDEGYIDMEEIKRFLRCGMGACQGRTCLKLVAQIISRKTGTKISVITFPKVRPPIRPVPIGVFTAEKRKGKNASDLGSASCVT